MSLSTGRFLVEQNVEQILKVTQHRWLKGTEIFKIFENQEKLPMLAFRPQQRPTSGSFFFIKLQSLREFRRDGYVWSKKKDGKTIQESHEKLKVNGVPKMNCLYAYLETNKYFQRRIYRMIGKEHVDIAIFHYREDKENSKKTTKVTHHSSLEARKAIPTLVVSGSQGSSSGIFDNGSNQLSLPLQTTDTSNLENTQENVQSADGMPHCDYEFQNQPSSQGTTDDFLPNPGTLSSPCELPDLEKSADQVSERNKNNLKRVSDIPTELLANTADGYEDCMIFQENPDWQESRENCKRSKTLNVFEIKGSPSDIVHHEGHQLNLSSQTTYTSHLSNIQGYGGSGGGEPNNENLSLQRVIETDFPLYPDITSTPCELLKSESLEQFSECFISIVDLTDNSGNITIESLQKRFENLLSLSYLNNDITEIPLEEKFYLWFKKLAEGESWLTVLDIQVIHLTAALGYNLGLQGIIGTANIDINVSDKNGYTALHWAAKFGRMHTVELLICEGAAPGLRSFPGGNIPADLAYAAGHHEVGDYLQDKEIRILAIIGSQGSSSGVASHGSNVLHLPSQTTDTLLYSEAADTSNHKKIQDIFPESPQSGMGIDFRGFFDTCYGLSLRDDMQDHCNDCEPLHEIGNAVLSNLGTHGSLCETPELMESIEPYLQNDILQ